MPLDQEMLDVRREFGLQRMYIVIDWRLIWVFGRGEKGIQCTPLFFWQR